MKNGMNIWTWIIYLVVYKVHNNNLGYIIWLLLGCGICFFSFVLSYDNISWEGGIAFLIGLYLVYWGGSKLLKVLRQVAISDKSDKIRYLKYKYQNLINKPFQKIKNDNYLEDYVVVDIEIWRPLKKDRKWIVEALGSDGESFGVERVEIYSISDSELAEEIKNNTIKK
tara:strand:+ start:99 stop:605 length:507 start_codon:yes stop_codon:yes gene_type:complete